MSDDRDCLSMNIMDVTCEHCGTAYTTAISEAMPGEPGRFDCRICGDAVASWKDDKLHVFRMVVPSVEGSHCPFDPVPPLFGKSH